MCIRDSVSNGCDAVTKLKKLALMGEYTESEGEKYSIQVKVNPGEKSLSFTDNGLGMTEQEVDEYINQIAFSGARDFLEKYKDKANDDQIDVYKRQDSSQSEPHRECTGRASLSQ